MIWSVDPGGTTTVWDSSSDYTSPDVGPSGLALDSDGSVLLVVSKSVMGGLGGIVYRITKPGTHTKVYSSDPNSTPNGIAVGAGGRIYVAATGSNTLIVLEKDGTVVQKIASAASVSGVPARAHSARNSIASWSSSARNAGSTSS